MAPFDPYHKWLGISETARPVSKYRLLSIDDFELDRGVISTAAERQTVFLRTLQAGEHEVLVAQLLNEVSQARVTLLNADQKAEYDEQLRKQQTPEPEAEPAPPPIPLVQAPTPVVVRGTVTPEFPVSVVQSAKKPRSSKQKKIWKRPAVIGIAVVGVIAALVFFASLMSSGDAEPVARNTAGRISAQMAVETAAADKVALLAPASITNTIGMKFNKIPGGTFLMGSPVDETDRESNETQHKVTITKPFYMQTTEVTQEQWTAVMGTEPWKGKRSVKEGPNYPATHINWNDAVVFCKQLSAKESKTYRLPTEAEWEYACRAGAETRWSFGDDEKVLGDYAWYRENAYGIGEQYAHQVGQKKSNAFGLHDMHGNAWEWCHDYYGGDYYKSSPEKDPQGPISSRDSFCVLRGGSWGDNSRVARSAFRLRPVAGHRHDIFGFRLVRELD